MADHLVSILSGTAREWGGTPENFLKNESVTNYECMVTVDVSHQAIHESIEAESHPSFQKKDRQSELSFLQSRSSTGESC
jgi:hypothetical protein